MKNIKNYNLPCRLVYLKKGVKQSNVPLQSLPIVVWYCFSSFVFAKFNKVHLQRLPVLYFAFQICLVLSSKVLFFTLDGDSFLLLNVFFLASLLLLTQCLVPTELLFQIHLTAFNWGMMYIAQFKRRYGRNKNDRNKNA